MDLIHVCVVDSLHAGRAYPRLSECPELAVVGTLPWLDDRLLPAALLEDVTVVLVAVDPTDLADKNIQTHLARLTRRVNVVALMAIPCDPEAVARLGVRGLVSRDVAPDSLTRVIRAVAEGEIAFPRSALGAILRTVGRPALYLVGTPSERVTPRQREVVDLIASGATDREIALRLRISDSTVHKHVENALRRTKARTRSHLVALLRQETPARV